MTSYLPSHILIPSAQSLRNFHELATPGTLRFVSVIDSTRFASSAAAARSSTDRDRMSAPLGSPSGLRLVRRRRLPIALSPAVPSPPSTVVLSSASVVDS